MLSLATAAAGFGGNRPPLFNQSIRKRRGRASKSSSLLRNNSFERCIAPSAQFAEQPYELIPSKISTRHSAVNGSCRAKPSFFPPTKVLKLRASGRRSHQFSALRQSLKSGEFRGPIHSNPKPKGTSVTADLCTVGIALQNRQLSAALLLKCLEVAPQGLKPSLSPSRWRTCLTETPVSVAKLGDSRPSPSKLNRVYNLQSCPTAEQTGIVAHKWQADEARGYVFATQVKVFLAK